MVNSLKPEVGSEALLLWYATSAGPAIDGSTSGIMPKQDLPEGGKRLNLDCSVEKLNGMFKLVGQTYHLVSPLR